MNQLRQNYYGSLCTEMYEILHEKATQDELDFYVSYAEKGDKILEALCGSGRFLVPFMEYGFDNWGIDFSSEMLIYEERYASKYAQPQGYAYAICLKKIIFLSAISKLIWKNTMILITGLEKNSGIWELLPRQEKPSWNM